MLITELSSERFDEALKIYVQANPLRHFSLLRHIILISDYTLFSFNLIFLKNHQIDLFKEAFYVALIGTRVALFICRCYAMKMADVCDDDGVSGASLRRKGAASSFSFFIPVCVYSSAIIRFISIATIATVFKYIPSPILPFNPEALISGSRQPLSYFFQTK